MDGTGDYRPIGSSQYLSIEKTPARAGSRTALVRLSKEQSLKEIALELNVSLASAKSSLHRARKRLARSRPLPVAS
jgi:DNA-directed RNA polymerase specialized sigma24 family protein